MALLLSALTFLGFAILRVVGLDSNEYAIVALALTPYAAVPGVLLALLALLLRRPAIAVPVLLVAVLGPPLRGTISRCQMPEIQCRVPFVSLISGVEPQPAPELPRRVRVSLRRCHRRLAAAVHTSSPRGLRARCSP